MKSFKIILLLGLLANLLNCNKIQEIKNQKHIIDTYKQSNVDRFYWEDSGQDYEVIPLVKPFKLKKLKGSQEWSVNTSVISKEIKGLQPVILFSCMNIYAYGFQDIDYFSDTKEIISPQTWFIINARTKNIDYYEKEYEFKAELKRLSLPEKFLNPDEVYEQFKQDPVLDWFPEDVKKQLNQVKSGLKDK